MVNISAVDLNLLVVLDALLTDGSVTGAARRVGLSQPAVSNALARLRDLFGDALLVRSPRAMVPTERAEALRAPLARLLRDARGVLEPPATFDPASTDRAFTIAATDYAAIALVPAIAAWLRRTAPRLVLRVDPMDLRSKAAQFRALSSGGLDLVLGLFPQAVRMPAGYAAETLAAERLMVIGRRDHPLLRTPPTLASLRRAPFVKVGDGQREIVEGWLLARGLSPRVAVVAPSLDVALRLAAAGDLLLIAGGRLAAASALPLIARRLPFALAPLSLLAAWADSTRVSEAGVWFRAAIGEAVASAIAGKRRTASPALGPWRATSR